MTNVGSKQDGTKILGNEPGDWKVWLELNHSKTLYCLGGGWRILI